MLVGTLQLRLKMQCEPHQAEATRRLHPQPDRRMEVTNDRMRKDEWQTNSRRLLFSFVIGQSFLMVAVLLLAAANPGKAADATADKDGFVSLFSGQALKHWRQCGPGHFEVTNGVATGIGGMGLWWYSAHQFTNFVLRGEFVQEQDIADSGIFLRFPNPKDDPWNAVHQGHEMEIGDPDPKDPTWRTGSIYPFQASTRANTKPLGQWNEYEITCAGQQYTVRMNGEVTMTWTDPKHRTDFGYIGLQNYNDAKTVRHRNLRVKELP